jgi:hypothetical protein
MSERYAHLFPSPAPSISSLKRNSQNLKRLFVAPADARSTDERKEFTPNRNDDVVNGFLVM